MDTWYIVCGVHHQCTEPLLFCGLESIYSTKSKDDLLAWHSWRGLQGWCFRWWCVFLSAWPLGVFPRCFIITFYVFFPKGEWIISKKEEKKLGWYIFHYLFL